MNAPFDGQEVVFISPEFIKEIAEIKKRQQEQAAREKALREQLASAGIEMKAAAAAIKAAAEVISAAVGAAFDSVEDYFRQFSEIWDEVEKIIDYDPPDETLKRWRAAQRRYSAVNLVRYKQFERERANRSAFLRRNVKIGRSGCRTGTKKRNVNKIE